MPPIALYSTLNGGVAGCKQTVNGSHQQQPTVINTEDIGPNGIHNTTSTSGSSRQIFLPELLEPIYNAHAAKLAVICDSGDGDGDGDGGSEGGDDTTTVRTLTYVQLSSLTAKLSRAFAQREIGHGDIVGVALERSVELVAVMLAVLGTGAAYLPLEPSLPASRVKQMFETARPKMVVISGETKPVAFRDGGGLEEVVCLSVDQALEFDVNDGGGARNGGTNGGSNSDAAKVAGGGAAKRPIQGSDLAYVMYTSGSTGVPKGCEVTHAGLCNLLHSMRDVMPGCKEADVLLAITTVSFDMAVVDWFLPLFCGATIVIAQTRHLKDMPALSDLMERHKVTMMQGTPSIWQMLLDSGWGDDGSGKWRHLGKIMCAGEPLPISLAERLLDCGGEVWNMYGATECSVYSSMWRMERGADAVLCGGPVANTHLYILDEERKPVPTGEAGELWIGGVGVGRGYRNNIALSSERFLPDPFHSGEGCQMYRTGDVGRLLADRKEIEGPTLRLLGRVDNQVKIHGHRIETGDVEAALASHERVSAAVVVGRGDRLVAYCVCKAPIRTHQTNGHGGRAKGNHTVVDTDGVDLGHLLRPWLADRLPAYMVPAFFVELGAFPMSLAGKIDRKALPDPVETLHVPGTKADTPLSATELEGQILLIWSKVLGHDRVRIGDNFFEIGGDSLRVVRVQKELEKLLGRRVPAAKLFEHYTLRALAVYLAGGTGIKHNNVPLPKSQPASQPQPPADRGRHQQYEDIAVISMACRLPGNVATPEAFWHLLETGGDAIADVPPDRWAHLESVLTKSGDELDFPHRGGFLSHDINAFDASFFGISPREARCLDPSQYLLLEACFESFERAGFTMETLRGSQTGVFVGAISIAAHAGLNPDAISPSPGDLVDGLDGYTVTGSAGATLSGRVAYTLGLLGPTMTIDAACASSLVTTHLACNALRNGECDMAVSAGVHLMLNPGLHVEFSRLQGMSADGRCRSFDAGADGTGWSEGAAVVLLKRLSDAQRDSDDVKAVIRGSAVNHGGRAASITTPSGPAQARLIGSALKAAGLRPEDVDYLEAHGTATKLGDPIEATALAEVFGPGRRSGGDPDREPLLIGAAKSNIGHTQAASGLVGLLKVVLALENGVLPQTLHIKEPMPAVDWLGANMAPVLKNQQWPAKEGRVRTAGVSAFGIGGTNAHVIVQGPPYQARNGKARGLGAMKLLLPRVFPFPLSGDTKVALRGQAANLHRHINTTLNADDQEGLADVAYSLATSRSHFRTRVVLHASTKNDLLSELSSIANPQSFESLASSSLPSLPATQDETTEAPKLAMLFAGQGTQWLGMGRDLCTTFPLFNTTIHEIAALFDAELRLQGPLRLLDVMWPSSAHNTEAAALLNRTDYSQPALFALEVSLFRLWQSWGVTPEAVLGHSLGEIAAAHVAGVMDLVDACRLVAARGRLMQGRSDENLSMAGIEASPVEVEGVVTALSADVDIAAYNTPRQTVISGAADVVQAVRSHFTAQGRKTKVITTRHAFHSRHMGGMLNEFRAVAEKLRYTPAKMPVISSAEGRLAEPGEMENAEYWVRQVRKGVRFSDGMRTLAREQGANVFVELGPDAVLCGMGAVCLAAAAADDDMQQLNGQQQKQSGQVAWLPSLGGSKKNGVEALQRSLGQMHARHAAVIDWREYFSGFGCRRVQLPTYAFQREFHLRESANGSQDTKAQSTRNQFEVIWQPASPVAPHTPTLIDNTWGLGLPSNTSDWATRITTTLSQAGIKLLQVSELADAANLDGFLCLWDTDDTDPPLSQSRTQRLMAAALSQLQAAAQMQFKGPLVWVTHHAVGTGDESDDRNLSLGPSSLLWGLMRTARSEHPELRLRLVDLGEETDEASIIPRAMLMPEPECAVRGRGDRLLVPRLQRIKPAPAREANLPLIREDGAVLITGGLGDLGSRVARWLVTHHNVRDLVLTSRHGPASPGADALVAELSALGARVTVVTVDVADANSVRSMMAAFTNATSTTKPGSIGVARSLRGVVHAAGVLDSGVLSTMTPARCETTLAPKAYGAWNLHEATKGLDLDFFVMFSSISGVMGMPGLANYAASNTFLDALAHMRRAQGLPATSVAYGTWKGDGMGSRLGKATEAHLAQYGLDPLEPDEGLRLLERAVVSGRALTMAAVLDLRRLRGYLREHQGGQRGDESGIPPFLRSLLSSAPIISTASPQRTTQASSYQSEVQPKSLREVLAETPDQSQYAGIVLNMVRTVVARALGHSHALAVEVDRPLKEIGIDSLTAVQMRNHLATLTGLTLSVNIVFMHPNLRALSKALLAQLDAEIADDGDVGGASTTANGSTTPTLTTVKLDIAAIRNGVLDKSITFTRDPSRDTTLHRPKAVFLTGATGFVGAFILARLLQTSTSVHCLVRGPSVSTARDRLIETLKSYSLWQPAFSSSLIHPHVGDISLPLLGLSPSVFSTLSESVDSICHCAGLVDWLRPLEHYVGPNIVSCHEILRLASSSAGKANTRAKDVHLISTISTLPLHMGLGLREEEDMEYGYGTSKYVAERLVAAARWRGARAAVYRLPFVTASGENGSFRRDKGDFLHNLITGGLELGGGGENRGGVFPVIEGADMAAVLPADYLARTIVNVMMRMMVGEGESESSVGEWERDFDFLGEGAPSCGEFFEMVGAAATGSGGGAIAAAGEEGEAAKTKMLPFGEWKEKALEHAAANPESALARIAAVLDGYTDENAASMFKGLPVGEHVFGGQGRFPAPVLDRAFVDGYLARIRSQR